jgi:hypothetical protein
VAGVWFFSLDFFFLHFNVDCSPASLPSALCLALSLGLFVLCFVLLQDSLAYLCSGHLDDVHDAVVKAEVESKVNLA